jgi:hypothetical protein
MGDADKMKGHTQGNETCHGQQEMSLKPSATKPSTGKELRTRFYNLFTQRQVRTLKQFMELEMT